METRDEWLNEIVLSGAEPAEILAAMQVYTMLAHRVELEEEEGDELQQASDEQQSVSDNY